MNNFEEKPVIVLAKALCFALCIGITGITIGLGIVGM